LFLGWFNLGCVDILIIFHHSQYIIQGPYWTDWHIDNPVRLYLGDIHFNSQFRYWLSIQIFCALPVSPGKCWDSTGHNLFLPPPYLLTVHEHYPISFNAIETFSTMCHGLCMVQLAMCCSSMIPLNC
jgi:hypothetical protein